VTISQTQRNTATISGNSGDFGSAATGIVTVGSTSSFAKAGVFTDGTNVIRYEGVTDTTFTKCEAVIGSAPSSGTATQHLMQVDLQGGSASGDAARLRDWWMDYEMGIIYFNNSYPFFEWNAVKVSYIYGERYLEKAIEEAATKMVVIDLLMSDDRSVLLPEGTNNIDLSAKVQLLQGEVDRILPRYREMVLFE